jgi:LemA protein
MDPQLITWIVVGALAVIALVAIVWIVSASVSMRRLAASVDERWTALAETLARRRAVAAPLLEVASEPQRVQVTDAFAALERASGPGEMAAAEAELQRSLRPLVQAAASQPLGSSAAEARTALAALDDDAQARRRDYNTGARELNAKARRFPTSLFVGSAGGRRDFFEVDQSGAVAEPPRIQF